MNRSGFTLIELMIVVTMAAVLLAIVIPKAGSGIRRALEATTKANIGTLRGSVDIYTTLHEGDHPHDNLECLVKENILKEIPTMHFPTHHPSGNDVDTGGLNAMRDSKEQIFYCNFDPLPEACGIYRFHVFLNCTHTTMNGEVWSTL